MREPRGDREAVRHLLRAAIGVDLEVDERAISYAVAKAGPHAWELLPAAADSHGVTLLVERALSSRAPEPVRNDLKQRAHAHLGSAMRTRVALEFLAPLLDSYAGSWALLKGAVLAQHVYRHPGMRSFSDVDVLVAPAAVRAVLEQLERQGSRVVTRNWVYLDEERKGELSLVLPNGAILDLHWNLLASPTRSPGFQFETRQLLATRREVHLWGGDGSAIPVLSAVYQLLHVATHAVLAGFGPLRLSVDLDQIVRHDAPDPGLLAQESRRTGTSLALAVAMQRAASALGEVPGQPGRSARDGRLWMTLMKGVNMVNPPVRSHEPIPLQFLVSSTRESSASSFRALGSLIQNRLKTVQSSSEFAQRLRKGIQQRHMMEIELEDRDEGHRDALLRQLDGAG